MVCGYGAVVPLVHTPKSVPVCSSGGEGPGGGGWELWQLLPVLPREHRMAAGVSGICLVPTDVVRTCNLVAFILNKFYVGGTNYI